MLGRGLAGQGSGTCGYRLSPGNLFSHMTLFTPETKLHARAGVRPHLPHDNIPVPEWHGQMSPSTGMSDSTEMGTGVLPPP